MPPFTYEEFVAWHAEFRSNCLEPALGSVVRSLRVALQDQLEPRQFQRVNVQEGRVKSSLRAWRKLNLPKYDCKASSLADVPRIMDDLIGTRIVCTNRSDVEVVQRFLSELPEVDADGYDLSVRALASVRGSQRDYVASPKDSGYRAVHTNVVTSIALGTSFLPVICEVQVRTLLQDSWGELTHEDTYKPGSDVPPLVTVLSRRIADLLSTLDDIADDLKFELERYEEARVREEPQVAVELRGPDPSEARERYVDLPATEVDRLSALLREWVAQLSRPVSLAELAWRVQRETEESVAGEWFGYGTFLSFLRSAVDGLCISPEGPGYVLPFGGVRGDVLNDPSYPGFTAAPKPAQLMRNIDRNFPLVSHDRLVEMYEALALAMELNPIPAQPDIRYVNILTASARDELFAATGGGSRVSLDYIAKSLLFSGALHRPLTGDAIGSIFASNVVDRLKRLGVQLRSEDEDTLTAWLRPDGSGAAG